MRSKTTSGLICLKDDYNFTYKIAQIDFTEWEDGYFKYVFYPFYSVIDMLPPNLFQGIPGLDLSLRREFYERINTVPVFISERTPSENREDLWSLLDENGMGYLNRLEWLIRTNRHYSGERFFVKPIDDIDVDIIKTHSMYDLVDRSDQMVKKLLQIICYGDYLECKEIIINDETRLDYYKFLMALYIKDYDTKRKARLDGIKRAVDSKVYRGRAEIKTDPLLFDRIATMYRNNEISVEEATRKLGMSRTTFYRRLRRFRSNF